MTWFPSLSHWDGGPWWWVLQASTLCPQALSLGDLSVPYTSYLSVLCCELGRWESWKAPHQNHIDFRGWTAWTEDALHSCPRTMSEELWGETGETEALRGGRAVRGGRAGSRADQTPGRQGVGRKARKPWRMSFSILSPGSWIPSWAIMVPLKVGQITVCPIFMEGDRQLGHQPLLPSKSASPNQWLQDASHP
jgi:hypothetical protein